MNKMRAFAAALAVVLATGGCGSASSSEPPLAGAKLGGPFSLVDQNSRRVSDADFAGKYRLVYFGYSFCPDVCPVDLAQIDKGLRAFEKSDPVRAARVVPIFITVDPARDTPAVLKTYAAAFHPRLVALSGADAEIAAVAKRYGVIYQKQPGASAGAYSVDHSRMAVLYGPNGAPIAIVPHDEGVPTIAETLGKWVK